MAEDERPDEAPWEVSEYRFDSPWWLELLFNWWPVPPLALVILILLADWLR